MPSHIRNYSSFETCFDMNGPAKLSLCQHANCHNGTERNVVTTEANNDWANKIPPHSIQARKALFSEEAGKLVLSLLFLFKIP